MFKPLVLGAILFTSVQAQEFLDYRTFSSKLIKEYKKDKNYATPEDVKRAIKSSDWAVVDVRTKEEWNGSSIPGSYRIGRQHPEINLANIVLDYEDNFVKKKIIVVCNSAARAAIEAESFKNMGFDRVMITDIYSWIDGCNPIKIFYSNKSYKEGTGKKFGYVKANHCK